MKAISEVTKNYPLSSRQSSQSSDLSTEKSASDSTDKTQNAPSTELLDDKLVSLLWRRMLAIYGHKWHSHLGVAVDSDGKLSDSARTWKLGLSGVTIEQVKRGFELLIFKNHEWPPSLPEFRRLCLSKNSIQAPPLAEIVSILARVSSRSGSLIDRYSHPLALAIAQHPGFDMFAMRTANNADAKRMVEPIYDHYVSAGWTDWPEQAGQVQGAIAVDATAPDVELGLQRISMLRLACGG